MSKKKYLIIIMLLLFPTIVLASDGNIVELSLTSALGMEAFVSIHMTIFVIKPLANMLDSDGTKKLFWILFIGRIGILLFFDLFITTKIAIIDFIGVFIGAFFIAPIATAITKKNINGNPTTISSNLMNTQATQFQNDAILKCAKCGGVLQPNDKFCQSCGTAIEGDNVQDTSPIVQMDQKFINTEKVILKNIIVEEIKIQGENEKTLSISSLNTKNNILLTIFGILTFFCVQMFYFNYSFAICAEIEIVCLIIYFMIAKGFNIIDVLTKQAIKNPDEDISNIVRKAISEKKEPILPNSAKLIITILAVIVLPSLSFMTPKLLYQKVGDDYYVSKYTRGLIQPQNEVIIPSTYNGKKVTGIQENAFKNTTITKVELPNTLESIKTKAFYNCNNLTEISIPASVTEIRGSAFENNKNLTTVRLSNGIKEIRGSAFKNCNNLKNITLPESLEYLGAEAFAHTAISEITIPKKVIEINGGTFAYCTNLTYVKLHDDIISIHGETFMYDSNLKNITLPPKITEIRGNTFEGCSSLTSIDIPVGVTRIGAHAFYGCHNLSNVTVPSTVIEIGSSAFRQCSSLKNIRIPYKAVVNERAFKESPTSITRY